MPVVTVTPLYAAALAMLMAILSTATGFARGKHGVALGDGGIPALALTIRRFGNLSEYAAMAIVVLLLLELRGIDAVWLHAYGMTLVALRLLHPFALFGDMGAAAWQKTARAIAAAGTAALLFVGAIVLALP